ncbi:MAG TPA: N-acetylmuramoyl-L-alanine amidase [Gemmatimonadales bacterium]|nr:N-acetylmuramoyl-L-alanine amidase [Gemmatimonadales bacterium]
MRGPLRITVVYPAPGDAVDAPDSSFLHGSVGTGDATLTINGAPVRVWPNGAWLAWVRLPDDTLMTFELVAATATDTARLVDTVRRVPRFVPPARGPWIDTTSLTPRGRVWWPAGEYLRLSARATPGATLRLRLPDGGIVPLVPDPRPEPVPEGRRAFDRDPAGFVRPVVEDRYVGVLRGIRVGPDPGPPVGDSLVPVATVACAQGPGRRIVCRGRTDAAPPADPVQPVLEAIVGGDTARAPWPLAVALLDTLPPVVELDDDPAGRGDTDRITVGRAVPGGTYHWFFPTGTRAAVSGRINDGLRLRLSSRAEAWVPAADARALPPAIPAPRARIGSTTLVPLDDRVVWRIPVGERIPFRVEERERTLEIRFYGGAGDVNWMQYGPVDSLVRRLDWRQETADELVLTADLSRPVWGYRTRWDRDDLLVEIRRPPAIDPAAPLRTRLIVLDPGHPPLGATGPTGLREAEANLGVALVLRELLTEAGARVVMTRTGDSAIDLWPRVRFADSVGAELLVSIHNNALPDGIDPFRNHGTSVYYNHPRSIPLALAVQRQLVRRLGIRDLGIGRGDLALVRPTWMPAILTEGLFMMLPEHEAALRSPAGQRAYARAVYQGILEFLRDRAADR